MLVEAYQIQLMWLSNINMEWLIIIISNKLNNALYILHIQYIDIYIHICMYCICNIYITQSYIYIYIIYIYIYIYQGFIQALLSTAAFPQRFIFFTACLVNYLCEVLPWQAPMGKFLKFRSPYCLKMHFQHSF